MSEQDGSSPQDEPTVIGGPRFKIVSPKAGEVSVFIGQPSHRDWSTGKRVANTDKWGKELPPKIALHFGENNRGQRIVRALRGLFGMRHTPIEAVPDTTASSVSENPTVDSDK